MAGQRSWVRGLDIVYSISPSQGVAENRHLYGDTAQSLFTW
ncbi:hypothetical protein PSPO01_14633 [Paraphaeosphaeria sporulosa]